MVSLSTREFQDHLKTFPDTEGVEACQKEKLMVTGSHLFFDWTVQQSEITFT